MLDSAVLSQAQREQYRRNGWIAVPGLVDSEWLERLRRVTDEFVDASRELTESKSCTTSTSGTRPMNHDCAG